MKTFVLIVMSNLLNVPVKIDGRQQHVHYIENRRPCTQARDLECRAFTENLRSWVALCLMDIFIIELVSNQLTVPVKIDGRQEQEENIGAIEPGSMYTHVGHACAGILVQCLAKLGGVVFYEDTPPNCNVQSVVPACEN